MKRHHNFSKTGIYNIAAQILVLLILFLVGQSSSITAVGIWHIVWLLLLILIPSAIWTVFFYLQDRNEPEPTQYVLIAFIAGMAAASLIALPLEHYVFNINSWMHYSFGLLTLSSVFIIGGSFSALVYTIIRYGFFLTHEFDEPVDGMVYGAMAGAGFAFVASLSYLADRSGYTLFSIGYTATTNVLMYTSVGALIGYIIGYTKFYRSNIQMRGVTAILSGMLIIGLYNLLEELILVKGFENAFWVSFIVTVVLTIIVLTFVYAKMRELTIKPFHEDIPVSFKLDGLPVLFIIIIFIVGGVSYNQATSSVLYKNAAHNISFKYPRNLYPLVSHSMNISAGLDNQSQTLFTAAFNTGGSDKLIIKVVKGHVDLKTLNPDNFIESSNYTSIMTENISVSGRRTLRFEYSYLNNENSVTQSAYNDILWAITDIIPTNNETYIFTYVGTPESFKKNKPEYSQILNSVTL